MRQRGPLCHDKERTPVLLLRPLLCTLPGSGSISNSGPGLRGSTRRPNAGSCGYADYRPVPNAMGAFPRSVTGSGPTDRRRFAPERDDFLRVSSRHRAGARTESATRRQRRGCHRLRRGGNTQEPCERFPESRTGTHNAQHRCSHRAAALVVGTGHPRVGCHPSRAAPAQQLPRRSLRLSECAE
jgi:hypothetical protein